MKNLTKSITKFTLAAILASAMAINLPLSLKAASPGALDGSFDGDGKVITNVVNADQGNDVAIQPDGKIVVVGRSDLGGGGAAFDFTVIRYNPDGSLDTSFDTDGKVTTDFGNIDEALGVAIQSDGKIVATGISTPVGGTSDFAIARYNLNGSLDTTFDTDGKVITDFAGATDQANSVAIQPDGKIIAGGRAGADFGLARYNPNGSLDTGFNTDGKQTVDFGGGLDVGNEIDLQPDGRIVIAGTNGADFAVARLTTNGSLDTTFDTDGKVTTDISANDTANSVAIQPDGKIVAAGFTDSNSNCALARYNTNGSLDITFNHTGKVITNFNIAGSDNIADISIQANGKIVAGVGVGNGPLQVMNALRYNPNGDLDATFGTGGSVSVPVQSGDNVNAVALSGDGKIVVVGDNNTDISMIRLNANVQPTAAADFDGDGTSDFAVYRPSAGAWFILNSGSNTFQAFTFGTNGDIPVEGDFDGDGRTDITVFRPSTGTWFRLDSSNNGFSATSFGINGDKPSPGDYDKDGKADIAVWRPSLGSYFILRSSNGAFQATQWGANGDIPIAAAPGP
jgi:uncharacterized delta-60 repeat protein